MHRRLQFGMCENPASDRRHGSRLEADARSNENYIALASQASSRTAADTNYQSTGSRDLPHAASPRAATGEERRDEGRLLTVHEVAELLRVPASWVYARTRRRSEEHLPGYRLGKYWRFRQSEILAWIDRQRGGFRGS